MQTNELIKKFKEMGFAVCEDESSIEIIKGFMTFTYNKYLDPASDTARLFALLDKYYQTPVKDRLSEKKYTIQVIANDDGAYLNHDRGGNLIGFSDNIETCSATARFTQSEIDELKQRDDLAIDWNKAIIKEVKDDED